MDEIKVGPDPVDVVVGTRVRLLRQARKLSQGALGDAIGVTFQQVQKYERATNRISISMLARMARALDTTIPELVGESADDQRPFDALLHLMGEPGTLDLVRAFAEIRQGERRRAVLDLVRAIADTD
ncbi:helix-turn-helix domain-containing protein [Phenylobacterium sp.]|uniref:helix-turn-helix domain-containing protein n=1 Tax=Phenylobacterium sp. TaxID=1871053 RepID=UPI003BAB6E21